MECGKKNKNKHDIEHRLLNMITSVRCVFYICKPNTQLYTCISFAGI